MSDSDDTDSDEPGSPLVARPAAKALLDAKDAELDARQRTVDARNAAVDARNANAELTAKMGQPSSE